MKHQEKRVCLINVKEIVVEGQETILPGERVMRTTRKFAEELIEKSNGTWAFTSKGKLKSFLNKNGKLTRAMRVIDALQEITGDTFSEKRERSSHGTKSYVLVPTFRYAPEKGEHYSIEVTPKPVQIKHKANLNGKKFSKPYTQTITPKKFDKKGNPNKELKGMVKKALFTKKQRMVETGQKKIIVAFP